MTSNDDKLDPRLIQIGEAIGSMSGVFDRALKQATRTCMRCDNFNQVRELCQIATPPARPPAKIIAYGCPAFVDEVPF